MGILIQLRLTSRLLHPIITPLPSRINSAGEARSLLSGKAIRTGVDTIRRTPFFSYGKSVTSPYDPSTRGIPSNSPIVLYCTETLATVPDASMLMSPTLTSCGVKLIILDILFSLLLASCRSYIFNMYWRLITMMSSLIHTYDISWRR